eukprot:Skav202666  [mRNA]  locus=scaffold1791:325348:327713:+ [translate_table: standard]
MPGVPPPCAKCNSAGAGEGDSWCVGCRALESSQQLLRQRWFSESYRRLGEELLIQGARQVKNLKHLDSGLQSLSDSWESRIRKASASKGSAPASSGKERAPAGAEKRASVGREPPPSRGDRDPTQARGPPSASSEDSEEEEEEVEVEEDCTEKEGEETTRAKSKASKPRSPSRSPVARRKRKRGPRPGHRGGAKHQRRYREVLNPQVIEEKETKRQQWIVIRLFAWELLFSGPSPRKPGSVLKLLMDHVRASLSDISMLDIGDVEDASAVTSQARVHNYFQVVVRPNLGNRARDEKEFFALSRAIDTLRSGNLERVADQLAARYMAVETAALEGSWDAAKWLELERLEDRGAAGPEVLLAARKFQRTIDKASGKGSWPSTYDRSWGAGAGDGSAWRNDGKGPSNKGKGQKGKKGRGKGKGGKKNKNSWQNEDPPATPKGDE